MSTTQATCLVCGEAPLLQSHQPRLGVDQGIDRHLSLGGVVVPAQSRRVSLLAIEQAYFSTVVLSK
jgi:hypothetical protein